MHQTKWVETSVALGLQALSEYIESMKAASMREYQTFSEWSDMQMENLDQDSREAFADFYQDEYWMYSDVFPNMICSSVFITSYSFFENELLAMCRQIGRVNRYETEMSKSGKRASIDDAKAWLTNTVGIPLPSQEWQNIQQFKKVRNIIVNNHGKLPINNVDTLVQPFIESMGGSLDNLNRVSLSWKFCDSFFESIKQFFSELLSLIPDLSHAD